MSSMKQQVIDEFHQFIETLDVKNFDSNVPIEGEPSVDLLTLCKEFIALKTEVKQEARHFKTALESFKEVFQTLQQSHDVLSDELIRRRQDQQAEVDKQIHETLKPLLLELIELRDRLEIGVIHAKTYNPNFIARFLKQEPVFVHNIMNGQAMTLRRAEQLLSHYEVQIIPTLDRMFDPKLMRAVELNCCPEFPNGVVIAEMRKGFIWKNEILRVAEVKVNKLN